MDEPSTSIEDAISRLNRKSSNIIATSTPMKRKHPPIDDEPVDVKQRKIEDNHSAIQTKQYFPIASLKEISACPEIKGTLTEVSDWLNARNGTKFLVFRLKDESGEIKGIAFEPMNPVFHRKFKLGATVILKNSKVEAVKEGNKTDGQETYKLIVNRFSAIEIEDVSPAPPKPARKMIRYILDNSNERDVVDVLGILEDVGEMERNTMREIRIVDESEAKIVLTLWDKAAKNFDAPLGSVIAAYKVAVRIYNSAKILRTCHLSKLLSDPPIEDTPRLKKWYSEWSAAAEARENEKSTTLVENTLEGTNNSSTDNRKTEIDASTSISIHQGNYISIEAALKSPVGALVNIKGFVTSQGPSVQQQTKSGRVRWMKVVHLSDRNEYVIEMAVWGVELKDRDIPLNSAIAAKNVTVREFNNEKTLSCLWTNVQIDTNAPQTAVLKISIPNNSTINGTENSVIAGSSKSLNNFSHCQNITSIKKIKDIATAGSKHNIVALVTDCGPPEEQQTKSGNRSWMRVVILMDDEDSEIEMAVWGDSVKVNEIPLNSVIMAKNVTVRDFNDDKTLTCLWSHLQIEPNVPQAARLRELIAADLTSNEIENAVIAGPSKSPDNPSHCKNITSIKAIKEIATPGSKHNIITLVTKCGLPEEQQNKSGNITWMRVITLVDNQDSEIEMAVWGEPVKDNDIPLHSVIMAKNVTVRVFNDEKTLSCLWKHLQIEPDVPQAERLKKLISEISATNETENAVIAGSSKSLDNSLHCKNITSIKEIREMPTAGSKYNIVALVSKCEPPEEQQIEAGKISWIRVVTLMDDKDSEIEMAVWGDEVKDNEIPLNSVIMARNVTVQDVNDDKKLTCHRMHFQVEPNVPQVVSLKKLIVEKAATNETENAIIAGSSKSSDNSAHCKNFTSIKEIKDIATSGSKHDIVALVTKRETPELRETKSGKKMWMRIIMLIDEEDSEIEMAVWGNPVKDNDIPLHSVIMAKNVTVRDFNDDKTLTCFWMHLQIEPKVPQAVSLRKHIPKYSATDEMENAMIAEPPKSPDNSSHCKKITSIKEIKDIATSGSKHDIVALVTECNLPEEKKTKAGKRTWVRRLMLMDDEDSEIGMVVWGVPVKDNEIPLHSVIIARNVAVRELNDDKILTCLWMNLQIEPKVPQAASLRELIPKYSATDKVENAMITESSKSPDNSSHCKKITSIKEIKDIATSGSKHDIIALVTECNLPEEKQTKSERTWMRRIMLMDDEDSEIEMVVCGDPVKDNDIPLYSVIMAKNVTVREFNDDKTLTCLWMHLQIEPNILQATSLRKLIPENPVSNETENAVIAESSKPADNSSHAKNITSIKEIKGMATSGSKHSIVARVNKCGAPEERQTKAGRTTWIRNVVITDDEENEIEMTVWGNEAKKNDIPLNSVIMARDVMVQNFNNDKTLSCLWSNLHIESDVLEDSRSIEFITNSPASNETEGLNVVSPSEIDRNSESQENFAEQQIPSTPISEIKSEETTQTTCNIMGIVIELQSPTIHTTEDDKKSYKRVIVISDEPNTKIELTIYGEEVMEHEIPLHCAITAQNVTIEQSKDDKTLNCLWTDLEINPDIPEADELAKILAIYRYVAKDSRGFDSFEQIMTETGRISKWNLIGLVTKTEPSSQLDSSHEENFWFTKVKLKDADRNRIELVIWSDKSLESAIPLHSILAVKGAEARMVDDRVGVGAFWHLITIDPEIPEAQRLKQVRNKDWNSRWPNLRENVDPQFGDYTPINMIKRWSGPRGRLNTIGLVVEVNPSKKWEHPSGITYYIRKCVLRGRDGSEIQLTIFSNPSNPFEVPLNSVIAVRDAGFKRTEDKEIALSCRFVNVDFHIDIPESKGFKEAALNTSVRFENPEDEDPNNFTAIKEIKKTRPPGSILNVLGLVVNVVKRRSKELRRGIHTVRVTLKDTDNDLIDLIIRKNRRADNLIPVNSVIAVRDAILRQCDNDKVLWCLRRRVEVNPKISEAEKNKLNKLKRKRIQVRFATGFIPFKAILHERSLVDCSVDIIGQVVDILPPDKTNYFGKTRYVRTFILRNEIDIKLHIWSMYELNFPPNDRNAITLNTILSAKSASVKLTRRRGISLNVNWRNVKINPQIPETVGGAKSLCIVPIKRIIEEAKVGDKLGILAVAINIPRKIFGSVDVMDLSEDSDEENRTMSKGETGIEVVKLIDSSGETIQMTMPCSVAQDVKKNSERTVVIQARHVQVCKYKNDLELACTSRGSRVDINPRTKETEKLLKWYDLFCKKENAPKRKKEERESPIIPINSLLENCTDGTKASIMGILIASQMQKNEENDLQFELRRIQIIDESEALINLLLWNIAAKDFDVPLYSIILVRNLHVYANDEVKWGDFGPGTEYKVITAAEKYVEAIKRLKSWYARYCAQSKNLTDGSDKTNEIHENSISVKNSFKIGKNRTIVSNDNEMVESPTLLSNDIDMAENSTVLSNDQKMEKSPTVLPNDEKIVKSPTVLSNDTKMVKSPSDLSNDTKMVKSPTVLSNDTKIMESPTVSSDDIEMAESPTVLPNDKKIVKSPTVLSNNTKMVKSPTVLSNDTKMMQSPTVSSNDIEMVESPTVLSDDFEMVKGSQKIEEKPRIFFGNDRCLSQKNEQILDSSSVKNTTVLPNDNKMVESSTVTSNDIEMVESPTVLTNDAGMVESSQKNEEKRRIFFGNDCSFSRKNGRNLDPSKLSDVIESDSESPDIFADC